VSVATRPAALSGVSPRPYQPSPSAAARRSAGGVVPPTRIGGCGLRTGFGSEPTGGNEEEPAIEARLVRRPQRAQDAEALVHARPALLPLLPRRLELLAQRQDEHPRAEIDARGRRGDVRQREQRIDERTCRRDRRLGASAPPAYGYRPGAYCTGTTR
jgi:hypothetical protein